MFHSARLKLTCYYLLTIMFISLAFSVFIYQVLIGEVQRFAMAQQLRIEREMYQTQLAQDLPVNFRPPTALPQNFDRDLVEETQHRLILILLLVDGSIFILAGGLGYFLAGRTLRPIQLMLQEQNRFISDSSHELRTPLTSLKTAMEVSLRDKQLKLEDAKEIISESIDEVNKLQALSDGLLQLAQYQKPKSKVHFEPLSLIEVATKAVRKVKPLADAKTITINNQLPEIHFEGDQTSLTDLLVILLDNAIKYTPPDKQILLSAKQRDGVFQILVQDQGIGIQEKDVPFLFDRFYRSDSARSRENVGGYGLGLAIAKKIVEQHHGSITAKKNSSEGSTFIVRLPLKQTGTIRSKLFS